MKFSAGHFSYRRVRRHIWDRSDEAESSPSGKVDGLVVSLPSLYFASTRGKPLYWYLRMKKVINPSVSVSALMTIIDFTLSNARRFYSSMGNPSDNEGLSRFVQITRLSVVGH